MRGGHGARARDGEHPARRPRLVLRLRRAARRPAAAWTPGDRRRWGRARGQLRGEGPRRPLRDGRSYGAAAVPGRDRGAAAVLGVRRGEQARSSRSSTTRRRWSRAISIDEAFLDVGGLGRLVGDPETIGATLRRRVREEVGLPISVGIARTKYLAKVASAVSKPDGLLRVSPEGEQEFLHPLPVERLWGVGAITAAKLHADGIRTIGELARREEIELTTAVGKAVGPAPPGARQPARPSAGRDGQAAPLHRVPVRDRPGRPAQAPRGARRAARRPGRPGGASAARRRADRADLHPAAPLRRLHPSHALGHHPAVVGATATWLETGRGLLAAAWPLIEERGCTLIGITISGLVDASGDAEQLELPLFVEEAPRGSLDVALDRVRDRFGSAAVNRAVLVGPPRRGRRCRRCPTRGRSPTVRRRGSTLRLSAARLSWC